tara:strand:+ start:3302 stop:3496 length:195 start_codon:yes stop_codon:yes gene_type:complete
MTRTINLILGILAVACLIYSFITNPETGSFLGIEINIWLERAFWLFVACGSFYQFFRNKENAKK